MPTVHHWWDAQSKQTRQTYRQSIQTTRNTSKTIHQEMAEDHKTKGSHDQGVEKHSCQIELRGAHLNLVYYNGKQVLRSYSVVHVTAVLYVRNEDEVVDTYTYMMR